MLSITVLKMLTGKLVFQHTPGHPDDLKRNHQPIRLTFPSAVPEKDDALVFLAETLEDQGLIWIRPAENPTGEWLIDLEKMNDQLSLEAQTWLDGFAFVKPIHHGRSVSFTITEDKRRPIIENAVFPTEDDRDMPSDKISPDLALAQLESLKTSLHHAVEVDELPSGSELRQFKYILVMLQMSGFDVTAVTWDEEDPEKPTFPRAYQVLAQVEMLISQVGRLVVRESRDEPVPIQKGYVFIIMAMLPDDPQLTDIHEAISKACESLGLDAQRVDEIEHTSRITDKIIHSIKKSEVVIADLTHNRPNCFYEAGYAHGFGKRVIFTAREGTELQFDIKDYSIIMYPNMKTLREKLTRRLQAVLENRRV